MRVFISSVMQGFKEHRDAAGNAVAGAGHEPVMAEDLGADPAPPRDVCLQAVRESEALILLVGTRYGDAREETGISPVEEEYWEARRDLKPVLVFVEGGVDDQREPRLKRFLFRIGRWESGHLYARFTSPGDLQSKIDAALRQVLPAPPDRSFPRLAEGVHELLAAFRQMSRLFLDPSSSSLPLLGTLARPEAGQLREQFLAQPGVLLVGDAGVGKTGICNTFVEGLLEEGTPVLFLRASAFASAATSIAAVEEHLPIETSIPKAITVLARITGGCFVVVDQIDSVGGTPWGTTVCTFLRQMAAVPGVHVLAVSRSYEAGVHHEIADLPFIRFDLGSLDRTHAGELLVKLGIAGPDGDLVELARNLLNLSLIADLVSRGERVLDVRSEAALWHRYRQSIGQREGREALARAVELARQVLASGQQDFPIEIAPDSPTDKLLSRSVLVRTAGERHRFFHEEVPSNLYAWDAAMRRRLLPDAVKGEIGEGRLASVLRWMHLMYHEDIGETELPFLRSLLDPRSGLSFFVRVTGLDVLKSQANPRDEVANLLSEALRSPSYDQYFLQGLTNPAWLKPLAERGVFERFPEPVVAPDKTVSVPPWWPGTYLGAVAQSDPAFVVTFAQRVNTANWHVLLALLDAAMSLPPEHGTKVAERTATWLKESPYGLILLEARAIDLLLRLAEVGQAGAAVLLLEALLEVVQEPVPQDFKDNPHVKPRARFSHEVHQLKALLAGRLLGHLATQYESTLKVLERRLYQALEAEGLHAYDFSFIWLRAIESPDPDANDPKEILVVAVRDLLGLWAGKEPDAAEAVLRAYLAHPLAVFRRTAIHTIREHLGLYLHVAREYLQSHKAFDDTDIDHELWLLVRDVYPLLEPGDKVQVLARILEGPREKKREAEERAEARRQRWLLRWLYPLKGHLPDDARSLLESLVGRFGEPESPEFLVGTTVSWSGEESPHSPEQLLN